MSGETGQDLEGSLKFYTSEYDRLFKENHVLTTENEALKARVRELSEENRRLSSDRLKGKTP